MASNLSDESFRDSIATINKQGSRNFLYPKKPSGKFYQRRKVLSYFLLAFLLLAPFVKINGNQFLLFNVLERKFHIFSFVFWPQDFYLFAIIMIIGVVGLTLFTVAFGRIFCGWFCPQTIFMEMLFRRIEYWIEGDRGSQIKLDKQVWNKEKVVKKGVKWILFYFISFVIANVFLSYLISSDEVLKYIKEGPINHVSTLIVLLLFTTVFYLVFAWFREQVCVIACPYGRLQGVLLDKKSIVVAYDFVRGEGKSGRAKFKKNEERNNLGLGDCIDCGQCVNVCPTGIDIRNGKQLECTNCTACIDECDFMMDKVGLSKGLIRYTSEAEIIRKEKFKLTTRMKGYTVVLSLLLSLFVALLVLRDETETTILRLPGQLFEEKNDSISNVYSFKMVNKSNHDFKNINFKLKGSKGKIILVGHDKLLLKKEDLIKGTLFIIIPKTEIKGDKTKLRVEIFTDNKKIEDVLTNFLGPRSFF